jgi:hypothetical protein
MEAELFSRNSHVSYVQKRVQYHQAFGRQEFHKILTQTLHKAIDSGFSYDGLLKISCLLKALILKIPEASRKTEFYQFNDEKVMKDYGDYNRLFDGKVYTFFLIENLNHNLSKVTDLTDKDIEIKRLLTLNCAEKKLLFKYIKVQQAGVRETPV